MTQILCIGSVLWDVIGRAERAMRLGNDVPGHITRLPGGVAMNIAMALVRENLRPSVLTAIGLDVEGDELIRACNALGVKADLALRHADFPTDRYMAIEGENGLIAAIADAHSLEAAGEAIIAPLLNGSLGSDEAPYHGVICIDGNLTRDLLTRIATAPAFTRADLRVVPASPGKAERIVPLMAHPNATLYVNLEEAGLLATATFSDAPTAARALLERGAKRVLVTDGALAVCDGSQGQPLLTMNPPAVREARVTGAGDTFMAAHIAAEISGQDRAQALETALQTAANYVAGETL